MYDLKVLVIDDDDSRAGIYQIFFSQFNKGDSKSSFKEYELIPIYAFTASDAVKELQKINGNYIVLIDMVLTKWKVDQLQSEIKSKNPPMIAVSDMFNDEDATKSYSWLSGNTKKYIPILHFASFRSLEGGIDSASLTDSFAMHLRSIFGTLPACYWDEDIPINLLHFTDLHMGDSTGEISKFDVLKIASVLNLNKRRADFLIFTGDLTDKGGDPTSSNLLSCIKQAFESGWMKDGTPLYLPSDRIMCCPGNHDFNEQLAASKLLKRNSTEPSGFEIKPPSAVDFFSWKHGLIPFVQFHESLTGTRQENGAEFSYRLEARFAAPLRISFLELWIQQFAVGSAKDVVEPTWINLSLLLLPQLIVYLTTV
jgi:Calcineurin-like phosphoesterase